MRYLLLCLLLAPALGYGQKKHKTEYISLVDKAFGFRDLRLETDIGALPEMQEIRDSTSQPNDPEKFYKRPKDFMAIGNAIASSITYYFYRDKLSSIEIIVDGFLNSYALLEALKVKYGEGHEMRGSAVNDNDTPAYDWVGKRAEVYFFGFTASSGKTYLSIRSLALEKKAKADSDLKAKSGL